MTDSRKGEPISVLFRPFGGGGGGGGFSLARLSQGGESVWSTATAHIRLVPTPTPTGVGDKYLRTTEFTLLRDNCSMCSVSEASFT